jgi:hypothetical protein
MKPSSLSSYDSLHGLPASAIHVFVIFEMYIMNFKVFNTDSHTHFLGSLLYLSGYLIAVCRFSILQFVCVIYFVYAVRLTLVIMLLFYNSYLHFCVCNYIVISLFCYLCCYLPSICLCC